MNLVENIFLDGCAQAEESNEQLEGDLEEESPEHSNEIAMVLWDMFPGLNLVEDDEVVEEGLAIQTRSKGPYLNNNQLCPKLQIQENMGCESHCQTFPYDLYMHKPSTSYSESMEYNIVKDLKKIKENISILDICKISQQCKLLLNALKDEEVQPLTCC
jgi:hypothetical protein